MPSPLYSTAELRAAFHLRYSWCGWLHGEPPLGDALWTALDAAWEQDGLRRLESAWDDERLQLTVSAIPSVSPIFLAQRLKGRLQHALRPAVRFSRKLSVRSLGDNRSEHVATYIAQQVARASYADSRYAAQLAKLTHVGPVDLSLPAETRSGRYWYHLHLVLVSAGRLPAHELSALQTIFEGCQRIAAQKGHGLAALSVLPDHVHLALRAPPEQSPESVALGYLNNLAYLLGQQRWWMPSYYAGTFGEYDMGAVRGRNA